MLLKDVNVEGLKRFKSDDFLPPISAWTRLGGFCLVGAVGAAIALAAVMKYKVVVKAPATVRPVGEIQLVQATLAGVITQILVQENQAIRRGDTIATLDLSQLQTQKSQLQSNLQNYQQQLTQLAAELSALDIQRQAEQQLLNRTIAASEAALSRSQREYQTQRITTQAGVREAEAGIALAQEQVNRYRPLAQQGVVSQLQLKEKEEALETAQAKLESARAALNPTDAPITISAEQIAQEQAKGQSTLAKLEKERQMLLKTRVELQNQLHRDQKQFQQLTRDLLKGKIQAPSNGTILKLDLRNVGQVVQPGSTIAQIAPDRASLVVKAQVAAQDISQVKVCNLSQIKDCQVGKAQLRISAYPYPDYGVLTAAVRTIAPDAITPQASRENPATPFYEVTLEAERPYLVKGDRHYSIQAGMDVTAEIIAQEETLLTFIFRKARLLTAL